MWTANFWRQASERAIKTFAGTFAAALGSGSLGLIETDWVGALSLSGMAAVISIASSVASLPVGPAGSASVVETNQPNTYERSPR